MNPHEPNLNNFLVPNHTSTLAANRAIVLVSRAALKNQHALWNAHLPFVRPYFAVKSNPDPHLLRWMKQISVATGKDENKHWKPIGVALPRTSGAGKTETYPTHEVGYGVDCASPAEMRLALASGFKSSDILYANTMKGAEDLKAAIGLGVGRTTVDSVEGVEQLHAERQGSDTEAIVRIAVDDTGSRSPFSVKFGAHRHEWRQVMDAISALKVRFGGVSFHVGSASGSTTAWSDAIRRCREFQQVCKIQRIPTLDIGGGFLPNGWHFAQVAQGIVSALAEWRASNEASAPESVIAEPGRFFSAPVETLIVPIMFKKESTDRVRYVLDDSVYGQFSGIVYDHAKPAWRLWNGRPRPTGTKQALFFGRTCDSLDLIATQDNAPQYKVGDRFVFPWMGAYTSASATRFNGFELPKRVYLEREGGVWNGLFEELAPVPDARYPIETNSNISLSVSQGGE